MTALLLPHEREFAIQYLGRRIVSAEMSNGHGHGCARLKARSLPGLTGQSVRQLNT
jgi:hypothetical protein